MTDMQITTIRVAASLATGQDRVDGPALLEQIRAILLDDRAVRLSFEDVGTVTPTLINEALVPLLDILSIETLRERIVLADVTQHVADTVRLCMELRARDLAGDFDAPGRKIIVVTGASDAREIATMRGMERLGTYGDMHVSMMDDATIGRLIDEEYNRPVDLEESLMDSMMRPTLRDLGITVIRCEDRHLDRARMLRDFDCIAAGPLVENGFDHRTENERWQQRGGRSRRQNNLRGRRR